MLYTTALLPAPFENILLLSLDGHILHGLYFTDQCNVPTVQQTWQREPHAPIFTLTLEQITEFIKGTRQEFTIPYEFITGTEFQKNVWQLLPHVAYGTTSSYLRLATTLLSYRATRAIGAAVARNPISIIVPCHRIIGHDGKITGYAGGLERKMALLTLEQH